MLSSMLLAATGSTPTTPQCDALAASIASAYTMTDMTTYHLATSNACKEQYNLYPRGQVIGHTGSNGWAEDDPAVGSAGWALVSHGIGQKLFTLNEQDQVVPSLASSVVKSGNDWVLTLKSGRKFSDGTDVTATAVMTALQRTNQALNAAQTELGTMTFEVQNALNLKIMSTIATPAMDVVLANWPFVIYKAGPSGDIATSRVFTGPYKIAATSLSATGAIAVIDDVLDLEPNSYYPSATERVPIKIKKFGTGSEVATALSNNEIDMGFNLDPGAFFNTGVQIKSFLSGYEYMAFINNQRTALQDINVRKALILAIDRPALAAATTPKGLDQSLLDGMTATGAFPSSTVWGSSPSVTAHGTDAAQAATLLDAAGWVIGGDGIRAKAGAKLEINVVYYKWRPDLMVMAPMIRDAYKALGIDATITQNDVGNYMDDVGGKPGGFDVLLWAQHTLPAGDPKWFLDTFFRSAAPVYGNWGQKNFAQIHSATIDTALDLITTSTGDARTAAVHAAHQAILDSYAVTFLTVPVWHVGLHSRMSAYVPWGSDYYTVKEKMPATFCSACSPTTSPPPAAATSSPPPATSDPTTSTGSANTTSSDDDNGGLIAGIVALAVVAAIAIISLVAVALMKKKPVADKGAKGVEVPTTVA